MPTTTTSRWKTLAVLAVSVSLATTLGACSSGSGSTSSSAAEVSGTGTLEGDGGLLQVFMPSTSNVYLKAAADSLTAQGEELGYEVQIVENDFDQTEQDQQVQEFLASGDEASAFLFWPASAAAATNSIRQLSRVAPVIQWNQAIQPDAEDFVAAYAGVSDTGIGIEAGDNALAALEEAQAAGTTFDGEGDKPNLLEIRFTAGYAAGDDREAAFAAETGDAFNVLAVEPTPTVDAQGGFTAASQVIPQYLDEGIDFIYAHSNDVANGVVQALEQNGLQPGVDVIVITGTSSGDLTNLRSGKIYSAVLQSPVIEGQLVVRTAAQFLATGETQDGEYTLPVDEATPELTVEAPHRETFMMNPQVTAENIDTLQVWDRTFAELN
ncbi:MAG: sugar transporter substrate-binding protein [Klenkia sp.]|nr:sugar transporter substrate-binding protein [Klenkia sp.]